MWACSTGGGESNPAARDSEREDSAPDTAVDTGETGGGSGAETGGETGEDSAPPGVDADGDGWTDTEGDCDDTRANVYPGAPDGCDALDQDCDGVAIPGGACGERWDPGVSASWVITGAWEDAGLETRGAAGATDSSGRAGAYLWLNAEHSSAGGLLPGALELAPAMTTASLPVWHGDPARDFIDLLKDAGDIDGDGLGDVSTGYGGDDAGSRDGNLYVLLGRPGGWPAGVSDIRDVADGWWTDQSGYLPYADHVPGADLDGDGHADLVLVTDDADVGVGWRPYLGGSGELPYGADVATVEIALTGTGSFTLGYYSTAVLPDLDGDGSDEIMVNDSNHVDGRGSILVVEGESLLGGLATIEDVGSYAYFIDPDAEGGGTGYFTERTRLADDLDGDGNPEISLARGFSDPDDDSGLVCTSLVLGGQVPEGELTAREYARVCPPEAVVAYESAWAFATDWLPDVDGDGLNDLLVYAWDGGDTRDRRVCFLRTSEIAAGGVYDDHAPEEACFWDSEPLLSDLTGDGLPEWIFSDDGYDDPTHGENAGRILIMEGFDIPFDDPSKW